MKPEVLVVGPMMPHVMAALDEAYVVHRLWEASDRAALLNEVGAKVRGIATDGHLGADAALMDALPSLEVISCYGVGVDAIDLGHAAKRAVTVTNTPGVLTDDVANLAIALLLAVTRRVCTGDRYVRSGSWLNGAMPLTQSLHGKRLGILGMGRIGRDIARKAEVFGLVVGYFGRHKKPDLYYPFYDSLTTLAQNSDFLIVSCPGGESTNKIVNAEVLEALGPEGILINIARGSVVDEPALVTALSSGQLGAAGLDVFADEPNVPEALLGLENVVLQPHQGSGTVETRRAMGDLVVKNLHNHFSGQAVVTPVV